MYDNDNENEPELDPNEPPLQEPGNPHIAWLVIIFLVGGIVYWQNFERKPKRQAAAEETPDSIMELQGKYWHGVQQSFAMPEVEAKSSLETLKTGDPVQHLRVVVLIGDLFKPADALKELDLLREDLQESKKPFEDKDLIPTLERLYKDYQAEKYDAPSVTEEEKAKLVEKLGRWHGELALHPPGEASPERERLLEQARTTVFVMAGGVGGALCFCGLGVIGLILFFIFFGKGSLTQHFSPEPSRGAIYLETFALWLVLFSGLQLLPLVVPLGQLPIKPLLLSFILSMISLSALFWTRFRGLSWSDVRQDIGLHGGTNPFTEVLCGIATYIMAIPLAVVGFIIMFFLLMLQKGAGLGADGGPPGHPIVHEIANAGPMDKWLIILVACVAAPVVEEIMFRGLLYRHLRSRTNEDMGFTLSFLVSGLVNTFIFAVIHPQGWVAVPALMALAFGFTIGREWRGSLIACMVAHAINNGILMLLAFAIFSG